MAALKRGSVVPNLPIIDDKLAACVAFERTTGHGYTYDLNYGDLAGNQKGHGRYAYSEVYGTLFDPIMAP